MNNMKGLELSERYYMTYGKSMIQSYFPAYASRIAAGLVGEGSECFGYDDQISRDHDWGPAFCLWLKDEDYDRIGEKLQQVYEQLPEYILGVQRRKEGELAAGRTGVMKISSFYYKYTGTYEGPSNINQWAGIPESFLATATNGKIFEDPLGEFTSIREKLLSFYPEDIRLKKISVRCALMGQSGQYNYGRALKRGNYPAASMAISSFMKAAGSIIYLLNKRYAPYDKWTHYGMNQLPILGHTKELIYQLASNHISAPENISIIERICQMVREELYTQGISHHPGDFLWEQAFVITEKIEHPSIRKMNILQDFV